MTLDKHLLEKMKASGCYRLHFGIEHGDPEFRKKVVRKPISTEHAKNVVRWAKKAGIWTSGFFIIGLPGETEQTYLKTIKFAKELDLDTASFFIATPYPGTDLYNFCIQRGYLPDDINWSSMRAVTGNIKTENFDPGDLVKLQNKAYKEFMIYRLSRELNPLSIIKRFHNIKSIDDLKFLYRTARELVRNLRIR
jgi:magnesium-protoporphyrin IX monomethyl ester (oxidative) cyclase